jgi:hypothetical protein
LSSKSRTPLELAPFIFPCLGRYDKHEHQCKNVCKGKGLCAERTRAKAREKGSVMTT